MQYDFGTIDPLVRDGSWLADALNQWRDALYSTHGGNAAPAYIVPGMVWRDVSGGAALTRYWVREAGGDRELWNIDNTGRIIFPAATVDWANITAQAVFKAAPTSAVFQTTASFQGEPSIMTSGAVAIGGLPAVAAELLNVRAALGNVGGLIETQQAGSAAYLNMKSPERQFQINVSNGSWMVLDATAGFASRLSISPAGVVTIAGVGSPANYEFLKVTGNVAAVVAITTPGTVAGLTLANVDASWAIHAGGAGTLYFYKNAAMAFQSNGWDFVSAGSIYVNGNTLQGMFQVGDMRYFQAYTGCYLSWLGTDGNWRFYQNNVVMARIDNVGNVVATGAFIGATLAGGYGNSGTLNMWNSGNRCCFRYEAGTGYIYIRVDEAVERRIWPQP